MERNAVILLPLMMLLLAGASSGFNFHNPLMDLGRVVKVKKDINKLDNVLGNKLKGDVRTMAMNFEDIVASKIGHQGPPKSPSPMLTLLKSNRILNNNIQMHKADRHWLVTDTFKWKSCGPKDQVIDLKSLTLKPQPLYFPGTLQLGFDIEFKKSVPHDTSLHAKINLEYESGSVWVPIPCMGSIGSCDYQDLCSDADMIVQCPEALKSAGIPCKCPFKQGVYKLDNMNINIGASVFLSGNYRGNVTLGNQSSGQLACYSVNFVVG